MGAFETAVKEVVFNSPESTTKFLQNIISEIQKPENKDLCEQFKMALQNISTNTKEENLTIREACAYLKIGRTSLYNHTREGLVKRQKLRGRVTYNQQELREALHKIEAYKRKGKG